MALVVKQWYADGNPNEQGEYIRLFVRRSGLIAWILSLMRLDPTIYFGVYADQVEFRIASLSGYFKEIAPVTSITSCGYGYFRPWKSALFIFVMFAVIGMNLAAAAQSILAALITIGVGTGITILYYLLKRELGFSITLHSGKTYGLVGIHRSVIEGQEIDERSFEHISAIMSWILRSARQHV